MAPGCEMPCTLQLTCMLWLVAAQPVMTHSGRSHHLLQPSQPPSCWPRSVDVARGVTVALMLYVNNADDERPWWQPHAVWNGLHLADVVMPAFLVSTAGHIQTARCHVVRHPFCWPAGCRNAARTALEFFVASLRSTLDCQ